MGDFSLHGITAPGRTSHHNISSALLYIALVCRQYIYCLQKRMQKISVLLILYFPQKPWLFSVFLVLGF